MLQSPSLLSYKAIIRFQRNANTGDSLFNEMLAFTFDHIARPISERIDFYKFSSHGSFWGEDRSKKIQIASYIDKEQGTLYWASKVRRSDPSHTRRRWTSHICLQSDIDEQEILLAYADSYFDYSALCFSPIALPLKTVPSFINELLKHDGFDCIDGGYQVPNFHIMLDSQMLPLFFDLLYNPKRTLPVFVLNGLDGLIAPDKLAKTVTGNGFVFFLPPTASIESINCKLPDDLHAPYESIQIYLPAQDNVLDTRTITAGNIFSYGDVSILAGIWRGFCESLRNSDRRNYVTVDDIFGIRQQLRLEEMEKNYAAVSAEITKHQDEKKKIEAMLQDAEKRYEDAAAMIGMDLWRELENQENLTNEEAKKTERLKHQIEMITDKLFSGAAGGVSLQETPVYAEIAHLLEALKYRLPNERLVMKRAK